MRAFFLSLFVLIVIAVCWTLVLWFALPTHLLSYGLVATILLHVIPPLVFWIVWLIVRSRRRKRRIAAAQQKEAGQDAERIANLQAAKDKYDAEMRERRFACHCKAVAVRGLALAGMEGTFPPGKAISIGDIPAKTEPPQGEQPLMLQALTPAIRDALGALYGDVQAARVFPLFLVSPSDISYREGVLAVQQIAKELIQVMLPPQPAYKMERPVEAPNVLSAPAALTAADSAIAIFEQNPDLPGAIILAFDSPISRKSPNDDEDEEEVDVDVAFPTGKPAQGVIALCLTNPNLPAMLDKIAHIPPTTEWDASDPLTPFWAKNVPPEGNLALLVALTMGERQSLSETENLAALHRGVSALVSGTRRITERARLCQSMIERNLVAVSAIDQPFTAGAEAPKQEEKEAEEKEPKLPVVAWLIHNAGPAATPRCGDRLVALGAAMNYFKIDLNPVKEASNVINDCGNWGAATPWAMLAAAIAHAGDKQELILCAAYSDDDLVATNMTVPVMAA